jgi:hypothetical protein
VIGGEHVDGFPQWKLDAFSSNGNQMGSQLLKLPQAPQRLGQLVQVTCRLHQIRRIQGLNGFCQGSDVGD